MFTQLIHAVRRCAAALLLLLPAVVAARDDGRFHEGYGGAVADGRLADVEIVDRRGRSLPVYEHRGRWYVAGEPGREYQIRIRNQRSGRLLAVTSVDGVNVISGQTAAPQQSGYVLAGYDDVEIDGWRKSMDRVARFYFTDLRDSYAARTGRPHNVGVIGVALYTEKTPYYRPWSKRGDEPYAQRDEDLAERRSAPGAKSHAEPQLGTGHGRNTWSEARYTEFERTSSRPAEVITIYYDSERNLVAQGVIPRDRRWASADPQPFPGRFVPDPWR